MTHDEQHEQAQQVPAAADATPAVTAALTARGPRGMFSVTPAGVARIEQLAREGLADISIAKALRVGRDALRAIRQRQPEVDEAFARGRSGLEDELTDLLLQRARDPKHPGCVVAAIYLTKARCGWREGDLPPGSQVVHAENVQINMPAAMTDEQFRALMARSGVALPPPPPARSPLDDEIDALMREAR